MKPGPAFIPAEHGIIEHTGQHYGRRYHAVPEGYIWQDATEWTGAGWVRPKGDAYSNASAAGLRPKGACYCDLSDRDCFAAGHWNVPLATTSAMERRHNP